MTKLSREMEKHVDFGKWREIHEGWVGNKGTQFPRLACFSITLDNSLMFFSNSWGPRLIWEVL